MARRKKASRARKTKTPKRKPKSRKAPRARGGGGTKISVFKRGKRWGWMVRKDLKIAATGVEDSRPKAERTASEAAAGKKPATKYGGQTVATPPPPPKPPKPRPPGPKGPYGLAARNGTAPKRSQRSVLREALKKDAR